MIMTIPDDTQHKQDKYLVRRRLKQAREEIDLSQAEVARLMKSHRQLVHKWELEDETGVTPSSLNLLRLSKILRKPIQYFYGEDDQVRDNILQNQTQSLTFSPLIVLSGRQIMDYLLHNIHPPEYTTMVMDLAPNLKLSQRARLCDLSDDKSIYHLFPEAITKNAKVFGCIDPEHTPSNDDFVAIADKDNRIKYRQLKVDGDQVVLVSADPKEPHIPLEHARILASIRKFSIDYVK